jgi:hypothetical protein
MNKKSCWGKNTSASQVTIHYLLDRVHESLPRLQILSQINPTHSCLSYLFKLHCNIIFLWKSKSSYSSISFILFYRKSVYFSFSVRATCIANHIFRDLIIHLLFGEVSTSWSPLHNLLHSPITSSYIDSYFFLSTLFSHTLRAMFLP